MAAPLQPAAHKLCVAVMWQPGVLCAPFSVKGMQLQGYSHVPHHFFFLNLIGPLKDKKKKKKLLPRTLILPYRYPLRGRRRGDFDLDIIKCRLRSD